MKLVLLATALLLISFTAPVIAADGGKSSGKMKAEITAAQREEMAVAHEKITA